VVGPTYPYGDSDVAGDRLRLLADVFAPSTSAFLAAAVPRDRQIALAVDLGCGPGSTTRLLSDATGASRTIGLDRSRAFVHRARADSAADPPGPRRGTIEFLEHDVTSVPFPVTGPDVVFARYLLAHLPEPVALIERWLGEARVGGHLLVEEIVSIETEDPVLGRYVELVIALSAANGTDLLVGRGLGATGPIGSIVHDVAATISPPPGAVARLFLMNLGVWRHDEWAQSTLDSAELDGLAGALRAYVDAPPPTGAIVWRHRQLSYERR
jgi:trans-aconitate 2-methyltransferase